MELTSLEIELRQGFGWTLQSSSARTVPVAISGFYGSLTGKHGGTLGLSGAKVHSRQLTDLTFARDVVEATGQAQQLEDLVDAFPAWDYRMAQIVQRRPSRFILAGGPDLVREAYEAAMGARALGLSAQARALLTAA